MNDNAHLLRHFLTTLAYRFHKAVKDAPTNYALYELGQGVRSPLNLLEHMNGVLAYAQAVLENKSRQAIPETSWQEQVNLFNEKLENINTLLQKQEYETETLERLLQGPLADAMTHVGQLALIRRMAGSAISAENFFEASIKAS